MSRSLLLAAALAALPTAAAAESGRLDERFDGDGVRIVAVESGFSGFDRLTAGLVDAQGRYVGAGNTTGATARGFALRVTSTGALDTAFGEAGVASIAPPPGFNVIRWSDIVEHEDGRLLLAGHATFLGGNEPFERALLCQLTAAGDPDPGFGEDGCVVPTIAQDSNLDRIIALALQPDGRAVALGRVAADIDPNPEYFVARFEADGSLDACFGDAACLGGGVLIDPEPDLPGFDPRSVAIAPDSRIVLAGGGAGMGTLDMAAIRLLPTGTVDEGFGNGGHRTVGFNQGGVDLDRAEQVLVTPNGRVLLVGEVSTDLGRLGGATALDANGNLLASYGDAGIRLFFFNDVSLSQIPTEARLQADGKLVVAGHTADVSTYGDCGAARLDADGDLDPVFGVGGYIGIDAHLGEEPAALDDCLGLGLGRGAIVLFGSTGPDGSNRDSLLIRLDQDGILRDGFEDQP